MIAKFGIILITSLLIIALSLGFSQDNFEYKGITYTSWTKGEYPNTTSWKPQTWPDSRAIFALEITTDNPCQGQGSLKVYFDAIGGDPAKRKGEAWADLRYHPPLFDSSSCAYAPFDLFQQPVTARVYITPEMYNPDSSKPNGLQLFFKSADDSNNWWSFYGNWHNIVSSDIGHWKEIEATPDTTPPPFGYKDPLFDPYRIVAVGLKFGTQDNSYSGSGHFWVDNLNWPGGIEPEYGFENIENSLQTITNIHADVVSVIVTWYMDNSNSINIYPDPIKTHSDSELVALIDLFHSMNMNVMLKPHVDVQDSSWRGAIQPANSLQWFSSYQNFIVHYARLADSLNVALFCAGTELESLSGSIFRAYWDGIMANVKGLYNGSITYAANWNGYNQVSFWDLVDLVGINAYFPLNDKADPPLDSLVLGWTNYNGYFGSHNWVEEIQSFQDSVDKPIIFTEIGYGSHDYAAFKPWAGVNRLLAPVRGDTAMPNPGLQARAYSAAFRVFQDKEWFKGFFWWNWLPWSDGGGECSVGFTPQNKPAQDSLQKYYTITSLPGEKSETLPLLFTIRQNYPNPFNSATTIRYDLSSNTQLRLSIYNVSSQLVKTLAFGKFPSGTYTIQWDGTDHADRPVSSGVYFYRLETPRTNIVQKMILLR